MRITKVENVVVLMFFIIIDYVVRGYMRLEFLFCNIMEAINDRPRVNTIKLNDISIGILYQSAIHIFTPTKISITARPYFKYLKNFSMPASAK